MDCRRTLVIGLLALVLAPHLGAGEERVRPGEWSPRKIPVGWVVVETEHYHVQSECGREKAERLAAHLEGVIELYQEFLPFRRKLKRFVLKIFEDRDSYLAYGAPSGSAAYYSQSARELVAYDTGRIAGVSDIDEWYAAELETVDVDAREAARIDDLMRACADAYSMDVAGILAHEGWHQYFHHYAVSWVPTPSWIDEGVGDYFYTAVRDPETGAFELGALNEGRLRAVRYAFEDGTAVDCETLLGFAQRDYYSNPGVFYAQGWSMVHFLMEHEREDYRALIPALIEDFKDTKNFRKTTDKVFDDIDLAQLDREWIGWVLTQPIEDPLMGLAEAFGDRVFPVHLYGHDRFATQRIRGAYLDRLERLGVEVPGELR